MKICNKCQKEKDIKEFHKRVALKDGHQYVCKDCLKLYNQIRKYQKPTERQILKELGLKKCNICNIIKPIDDFWRQNGNSRGYRCKECSSNYRKSEQYKKQIRNWENSYRRNKRKNDINYYLRTKIRSRILRALKRNSKKDSSYQLLGCSIQFLKEYLESKFQQGMSWNNRDKWHIDHILPCSSFDLSKEENQRKCFHYSNLQPLWAKDNLLKSDKINS